MADILYNSIAVQCQLTLAKSLTLLRSLTYKHSGFRYEYRFLLQLRIVKLGPMFRNNMFASVFKGKINRLLKIVPYINVEGSEQITRDKRLQLMTRM
jgi:hypothetical protein